MSDDWKTSVDQQLGQLRGDVRNLLFGLIGFALLLIAGGATAFVLLDNRLYDVKADTLAIKADLMMPRSEVAAGDETLDNIEAKLDRLVEQGRPSRR